MLRVQGLGSRVYIGVLLTRVEAYGVRLHRLRV